MPDTVSVPAHAHPKVLVLVQQLVTAAESLFGAGNGQQKKEWVKQMLKTALHKVNIAIIPDFIEEPLKDAVVNILVDVVAGTIFPKATTATA